MIKLYAKLLIRTSEGHTYWGPLISVADKDFMQEFIGHMRPAMERTGRFLVLICWITPKTPT